jgi:hypothetical protein
VRHSRIREPDWTVVSSRLAQADENSSAELPLRRLPVRREVPGLPHRDRQYAGSLAGKGVARIEGSRRKTSLRAFALPPFHVEACRVIGQWQSATLRRIFHENAPDGTYMTYETYRTHETDTERRVAVPTDLNRHQRRFPSTLILDMSRSDALHFGNRGHSLKCFA